MFKWVSEWLKSSDIELPIDQVYYYSLSSIHVPNIIKPVTPYGYRKSPYDPDYKNNNTSNHPFIPITVNLQPDISDTQIDHYKTLKDVSSTEPYTPKHPPNSSDPIFVMNGYGVNITINGVVLEAFLDTGDDKEIYKNQQVLLYHEGIYNNTIGTVINSTGNERKGGNTEILIQSIL